MKRTAGKQLMLAARVKNGHHLRLAGEVRSIPDDFPADKRALKALASSLWQLSVALGHVMSAHSRLSKTRALSISPDGLIGGRGYAISFQEVRADLAEVVGKLTTIADALHDEIQGPHWHKDIPPEVKSLIEDSEDVLDDPEGKADAEYQEEFGDNPDGKLDAEGN